MDDELLDAFESMSIHNIQQPPQPPSHWVRPPARKPLTSHDPRRSSVRGRFVTLHAGRPQTVNM